MDTNEEDAINPKSSFREKLSVYFTEYSSNTSLHGIKYIGDNKRTLCERALWTIVILISIITCICLISNTYVKWATTPIILVEDKEPKRISSIPFPAITICPENKVNTSIYNFTEDMQKFKANGYRESSMGEEMNITLTLCDELFGQVFDTEDANQTERVNDIDTREFIRNISSGANIFGFCRWSGRNFHCESYFNKVFTEDGVCYSFNGLQGDQIFEDDVVQFEDFWTHDFNTYGWTIEKGYDNPIEKDTYPRRMFSSGGASGLSMYMAGKAEDLDYACRNLPEAYKVIFHYPSEIPRAEKFTRLAMTSVLVEAGTDVSVSLIPKVITTSEALRRYKPKERGCFYPTERKLRYFKLYSQQKCEYECIANATWSICGCIAYYMPMVNDTPICRSNRIMCMQYVKEAIANEEHHDGLDLCNCLPTCTSTTYSADISMYTYDLKRRFRALGVEVGNLTDFHVSKLTVSFKEAQYYVSQRSELYGFTDFISNCGGLFGLFVGFSLISLLELVYFITIRIFANTKQYGRDKWYGSRSIKHKDGKPLQQKKTRDK